MDMDILISFDAFPVVIISFRTTIIDQLTHFFIDNVEEQIY